MKIGRVYKIIARQSNECYVGSTFDQLNYRFKGHKASYKNNKGCSVNELFDEHGVENCKIMLIKEYEVIDRRHLEVYETLWIKKLRAINKIQPAGGLLNRDMVKRREKRHKKAMNESFKIEIEADIAALQERFEKYHN